MGGVERGLRSLGFPRGHTPRDRHVTSDWPTATGRWEQGGPQGSWLATERSTQDTQGVRPPFRAMPAGGQEAGPAEEGAEPQGRSLKGLCGETPRAWSWNVPSGCPMSLGLHIEE